MPGDRTEHHRPVGAAAAAQPVAVGRDRVDGRGADRARVGLAVLARRARRRRARRCRCPAPARRGRRPRGCRPARPRRAPSGSRARGRRTRRWESVVISSSPSFSADMTAAGAVWPRPQIDASCMTRARSSSRPRSTSGRGAAGEPGERLLLADGADPARHALPARLVAEERGDAPQRPGQVGGAVEDEDDAGAERGPDLAGAFEGERHVELVGQHEPARRAAEQDRPQVIGRPARERQQLAQGGAERHLVHARHGDRAGDAEQLRPGGPPAADLRERGTADGEDLEDVVERLHVVDHRGARRTGR